MSDGIDETLAELEAAYMKHDMDMIYIQVDTLLDELRDSPQFQNIIKRMKFPK